MSAPGTLWVGSIVMEVHDFERMIEFWTKALGYETREAPEDGWVVLHDPHRMGPNLSLQRTPDRPGPDYRFHLDLYSSDPTAEVERLIGLGATMREPAREGRDFVTLDDPDGNPIDVIDNRGFAFGQRVP